MVQLLMMIKRLFLEREETALGVALPIHGIEFVKLCCFMYIIASRYKTQIMNANGSYYGQYKPNTEADRIKH